MAKRRRLRRRVIGNDWNCIDTTKSCLSLRRSEPVFDYGLFVILIRDVNKGNHIKVKMANGSAFQPPRWSSASCEVRSVCKRLLAGIIQLNRTFLRASHDGTYD
jgi:hypothetical protein